MTAQRSDTVLVVEDDPFSRIVLAEMCRELGYGCIDAIDGQDAQIKLSENVDAICVVLMDLHMPGISGVDAVRAIRDNPSAALRRIPIVATTADVRWHDPRVALRAGFDGVLQKPAKLDALHETLQIFADAE
ncbi:response regulator [uncultured Roseobacter sp.]|uniref:response regulator n=1 Tax=uncultured Roseobacter sp. TaxID=114847 RepID=UPI0026092331|nr:response regulator [uncultured Roseobacter sp.]